MAIALSAFYDWVVIPQRIVLHRGRNLVWPACLLAGLACSSSGGDSGSGSGGNSDSGSGGGGQNGGSGGESFSTGAAQSGAVGGQGTDASASGGSGSNSASGGEPLGGSGGDDVGIGGSSGGDSSAGGDSSGGGTGSGSASPGAGGQASEGACQSNCGTHKWACWPMPNPASSPSGVPHPQEYEDRGDGTVLDKLTCLTWEKTNEEATGDWQANFDRCENLGSEVFAGHDDWRLPTRIEMASISDVTLGSTGYPRVFEVTGGYYVTGSDWYKTILTDGDEDRVWGYGTNGFTSNAIVKSDSGLVARCVSGGGGGEASDEYAVQPPEHYELFSSTARDTYTGLSWQRGFSSELMSWAEAPSYCEGLSLDGFDDFRVPTLNELASTVNEAKVGGAIVEEVFPGNPEGCREPQYWFWAAEESKIGGEGWGLSYCDGFTGANAGSSGDWNYFPQANVRCVR